MYIYIYIYIYMDHYGSLGIQFQHVELILRSLPLTVDFKSSRMPAGRLESMPCNNPLVICSYGKSFVFILLGKSI